MTTLPPTASPRPSASRIDFHPEAVAIMKERVAKMGGELNEARMRMTRIPAGARAGRQQGVGRARLLDRQCHHDGRRAVDHAGDARRGGAQAQDRRQDAVGHRFAPTPRKATSAPNSAWSPRRYPDAIIGSYPFIDEKAGPNTNIVVRSRDPARLKEVRAAVEAMLAKVKAQTRQLIVATSLQGSFNADTARRQRAPSR